MPSEIRLLKSDEYQRVADFIDQHWAKNHVYVRHPELFDWTFRRSDLWSQDEFSFAIAEDDKKIIGILGAIPFEFNSRGETSKAMWTANWMTRPCTQAGGAGIRLMQFWADAGYSHRLPFGTNAEVNRLFSAMRWTVVDDIPRHFLVLPAARERMISLLRLTYPEWSQNRASELTDAFLAQGESETDASFESEIHPDWDERGWAHFKLNSVGGARNFAYLNWRYTEHPMFDYRIISIQDGDRIGLAVWRSEMITQLNTEGEREPVVRIARLVEFIPASERNSGDLFGALVQAASAEGCFAIDYFGYHGRVGSSLEKLGFPLLKNHIDGAAIPGRFQPLDYKSGKISSALSPEFTIVPQYPFDASCDWYWTKSDGDQDRPN